MQLVDFIVCDDIRREEENKVSLVGIYNESIKITFAANEERSWPVIMPRLGVYVRILLDSLGEERPDSFRISFSQGGSALLTAQGVFQYPNPNSPYFALLFIANFFPLASPGKLETTIQLLRAEKLVEEYRPRPIDVLVANS